MPENSSNNKLLIKNTIFLYIRMFLTMGVALYTSRVVLNVLGVEDYGIYNVVGGVVAMLTFLNNTLSGATSRFLTYDLGRKDYERLKKTFRSSLCLHIALAIILVLILESLGPWFVSHKLTIPAERLDAAVFVYHFSILVCIVSLLQLPFNAAIIAHEKMDAFAYISIFDVMLKFVIVYFLQIVDFDKLKVYGVLVFIVSVITALLYVIYSKIHFKECTLRPHFDREIAKQIISFSGWDLYGNFSVVVRSQGLNILQNMFFGPIINASTGIANQVLTAIMGFAENFLTAAKPQIIKSYAEGNIGHFTSLVNNMSKYCTLLLFLISFPLFLEIDYVLRIWLINVPDYAAQFCRLSIVNNWISIIFRPVVTGIYATGNAKRISIINGSVYLLVLPLSFVFLKMGGSPIVPFVLNIILLFIGHTIFTMKTIKKYISSYSILSFYKDSVLPTSLIMFASAVTPLTLHYIMSESLTRFVIIVILSVVIITTLTYCFALSYTDRLKINEFIKSKFKGYDNR